MQEYKLELQSEIFDSFRCQLAANSLDIDVAKKSVHNFSVKADITSPFTVGLIVGASGSGKTQLAKHIYGQDCFKDFLDLSKPIIEQFPKEMKYEQCAELLAGVGLTSVPCWIRPAYTLSNGQRSRAECALQMVYHSGNSVIDEWTSVVDRTVAKVMSHCIQKFARKNKKQVVLISCHYDVAEWLDPDWIIDCNKQEFIDRRSLRQEDRARKERLEFDIRPIDKTSWKYFSKYHYLSEKLPGGKNYYFGLFDGNNQIGFQCFSNYVPKRPGQKMIYHFNRTVIHPDYAGLGLGIQLINKTSEWMAKNTPYRIMGKFSSTPIFKSMTKQNCWQFKDRKIAYKAVGGKSANKNFMRTTVVIYSFEYIPSGD